MITIFTTTTAVSVEVFSASLGLTGMLILIGLIALRVFFDGIGSQQAVRFIEAVSVLIAPLFIAALLTLTVRFSDLLL